MKRRTFLKKSSLGAVGTLFMPNFITHLKHLEGFGAKEDFKKLVVIQLSGGNDGLNTLVPFEDDLYYQYRPKISIPKNEVLKLNDTLGFNPSLEKFHRLYKDGFVSVINNVGYPNPNRSHFRSMDIWHSASDADQYSKTGWLGRFLDAHCTNSHAMLEIDNKLSLSLQGKKRNGLAVKNAQQLYRALNNPYFDQLIQKSNTKNLSEDNLGYLYKTLIQTNESAAYLAKNHDYKQNAIEFPKSKLGKKLDLVSQFIQSDYSTQVYYVSHNGFDSHVNQRNAQDRLLKDFSDSLYAFVKSLQKAKRFENCLILVFSEFGRRVKENGSRGTDHGKANNTYLIGQNLKNSGIHNEAPNLKKLDDGDLNFSLDFRNIYADIIQDWFNKNPDPIIQRKFKSLNII